MKILIADKLAVEGIELLQEKHEVHIKTKLPEAELINIIGEYDALVVRSETKVTKAVLEAAKNLKVVGRAGVGVDNINIPAATANNIMVVNAPDGNTIAAVEHTLGMILALARHIPKAHQSVKEHKWERSSFMGVQLSGKTLGILGLGRIGKGIAKRARALDMKVIAYDPYINLKEANALDIEVGQLIDVMKNADFLTLHLPLVNETKNLINAETIQLMKDGVRIINCARGGVIDEKALAEAIIKGKVEGAAIDVFAKEPLDADNQLLELEKVILTPHLGASTKEAQIGVAVDVAEAILLILEGKQVTNVINAKELREMAQNRVSNF